VGLFGAGEEFLRKLWCILSARDALVASANKWFASVETKIANTTSSIFA
jgi:hypothetical protein